MQVDDDIELVKYLVSEGYSAFTCIPGRGLCGIRRMLHTTGLFYNVTRESTGDGRYCFYTMAEAIDALTNWDGIGDPQGDWIKHKGITGDYSNPNTF